MSYLLPVNYWLKNVGVLFALYLLYLLICFLAGFDINVEYPFQALGPSHGGVALSKAAVLNIPLDLLATLASSCWRNQRPVFDVGGKYTMEARQVDAGLGHQGRQPRHKIQRFEMTWVVPFLKGV